MKSWIGVDLDGTLAHYDGFKGRTIIGAPIPSMVRRVKRIISAGKTVKIFTARLHDDPDGKVKLAIEAWCKKNLGEVLEITNVKDYGMLYCYDDRAIQVELNTGRILGEDLMEEPE